MTTPLPIGTTKGPGLTPHEFTFVAPDPQQRLKFGEFVYYQASVDGTPRHILGRIGGRAPLRLFPDAFSADPAIAPQDVASLLGYDEPTHELFEMTVVILGYYDRTLGFVNPRTPPRAGEPIYIAPDAMLSDVLCRVAPEGRGAVHIGSLLSRSGGQVPIALDARGFTSTHLAIIASTGSGKSYLAGVILEELMRPHNRAAVLVIDPHAEYASLDAMRSLEAFRHADGYQPEVRIYHADQVKVRVSTLTVSDLYHLLPNMTDRMRHVLAQAVRRISRDNRRWTRDELLVAVRQGAREVPVTDPEEQGAGEEDPSVGALIWRIESVLKRSVVFDDFQELPLDQILRPGQCTILELNEVPEDEQRITAATLLRRIYHARMETSRHRAQPGEEGYLPYPAFVLIEEAHNFAPANAEVTTTPILKTILSEGRKFGVAVGLISQRPGKLDGDVLSQCMTQCIMRIVNPIDQARIAESVESAGRELMAELPALSRGQVIVAGASVNTPVLVQVRPRLTPHGANDPDAPQEWLAYFSEAQRAQRARDEAPPSGDERRRQISRLGGQGLPF